MRATQYLKIGSDGKPYNIADIRKTISFTVMEEITVAIVNPRSVSILIK